jgi:hypothetical protein
LGGRAVPYLGLVLLNFWLFAPRFFTSPLARWQPFTPEVLKHGALYSGYRYVLQLCLRRDNLDMFRWSVDFALLALFLVWTARSRLARSLRVLCTTTYVVLWVFLAYHYAVKHFYERSPALFEDIRLTLNLWHFVQGFARYSIAVLVAVALYLALLSWLTARAFRFLQLRAAGWSPRQKLQLSAAVLGPALLSLLWYGTPPDAPLIQLNSKAVAANIQVSIREAKRMAELRSGEPDLRYEAFAQAHLAKKPDVYLIMVEAYGEILSTWDMNNAYHALMDRVQDRLGAAGYHMATTYSVAPVHGGTSWFSISTVHTGITIDRPQAYDALKGEGASIPSITQYFRGQGYLTHALQPGVMMRSGLNRFDIFNHEIPVDSGTIDYRGPKYGWGVIPDQYSIGVFRDRYFKPSDQPRYAFYMGVSTHYMWDHVPPYVADWRTLQEPTHREQNYDESWPRFEPDHTAEPATEMRRNYYRSVEYEWRIFTEWFEAEANKGNVILVVGDHQPRLEWDAPGGVTMNTPVHVISQDAALVERFRSRGFQSGMYAKPENAKLLQHAGLFSLFVSEMVDAYGVAGAPKLQYYPRGLPLAALNR